MFSVLVLEHCCLHSVEAARLRSHGCLQSLEQLVIQNTSLSGTIPACLFSNSSIFELKLGEALLWQFPGSHDTLHAQFDFPKALVQCEKMDRKPPLSLIMEVYLAWLLTPSHPGHAKWSLSGDCGCITQNDYGQSDQAAKLQSVC